MEVAVGRVGQPGLTHAPSADKDGSGQNLVSKLGQVGGNTNAPLKLPKRSDSREAGGEVAPATGSQGRRRFCGAGGAANTGTKARRSSTALLAAGSRAVSSAEQGRKWQPVPGVPARELWCQEVVDPPGFCVACRGPHSPGKVRNPRWQPYTPKERLGGLGLLPTEFQHACEVGTLPAALDGNKPGAIKWLRRLPGGRPLVPGAMDVEHYRTWLPLLFHGAREGHEPYRYLASETLRQMLDVEAVAAGVNTRALRFKLIVPVVKELVFPIRLGLNTFEPALGGHMMVLLQQLLRSHPAVGSALVPFLKLLLPALAVYRSKPGLVVQLPPPFCVGSTGSRAGRNCVAPEAGRRVCDVCGRPVDKILNAKRQVRMAKQRARDNAMLADAPLPSVPTGSTGDGRAGKPFVLSELVEQTLDLICGCGGRPALDAVQRYIPTYDMLEPP